MHARIDRHDLHAGRLATTYGGWGKVVYGKLDEEYEQRKKEEKAEARAAGPPTAGSATSASACFVSEEFFWLVGC